MYSVYIIDQWAYWTTGHIVIAIRRYCPQTCVCVRVCVRVRARVCVWVCWGLKDVRDPVKWVPITTKSSCICVRKRSLKATWRERVYRPPSDTIVTLRIISGLHYDPSESKGLCPSLVKIVCNVHVGCEDISQWWEYKRFSCTSKNPSDSLRVYRNLLYNLRL